MRLQRGLLSFRESEPKETKMKVLMCVVAFVLVFCFGRTAQAQFPSGPPGQVCQQTNNLEGYFSTPIDTGTCVLLVESAQTGNPSQAVASCKALQAEGYIGDMTIGDCVRAMQSAHDFGATRTSVETFALLVLGWAGVQMLRRRRNVLC
jgi:hypothetical protein